MNLKTNGIIEQENDVIINFEVNYVPKLLKRIIDLIIDGNEPKSIAEYLNFTIDIEEVANYIIWRTKFLHDFTKKMNFNEYTTELNYFARNIATNNVEMMKIENINFDLEVKQIRKISEELKTLILFYQNIPVINVVGPFAEEFIEIINTNYLNNNLEKKDNIKKK